MENIKEPNQVTEQPKKPKKLTINSRKREISIDQAEEEAKPLDQPVLLSQPSKNTICLSPNKNEKTGRQDIKENLQSTQKTPSNKELLEEKDESLEKPAVKKDRLIVPLTIEIPHTRKKSGQMLTISSVYQVLGKIVSSGIDTTKDPGTIIDNNVAKSSLRTCPCSGVSLNSR